MKRKLSCIASGIIIFLLIIDFKTSVAGISEGIDICLKTVIPALFPFFVLTNYFGAVLSWENQAISRLLKIPSQNEGAFLLGCLGGYPTGAKLIADRYASGKLDRQNAKRMMAFSSNAGPAFLFGVGGVLFENVWLLWILWGIHILSALVTAVFLPKAGDNIPAENKISAVSFVQAMENAVRTMGLVCGWVLFFRMLINMSERWFLWLLPSVGKTFCYGVLELSNGAVSLVHLENTGLRFILFGAFLGFGGLCVALQTASAAREMGITEYFLGKGMQTAFSIGLLYIVQILLLPKIEQFKLNLEGAFLLYAICGAVWFLCFKICSRNLRKDSI